MLLVAEQHPRMTGVREVMAKIALHVYREPTQVAALDEGSHASRHVAELVVMPDRELEPPLIGECDKSFGLLRVERDRLLHIDMAPALEAQPSDLEMALRRRRNVNDVGPGVTQKFGQVAEIF